MKERKSTMFLSKASIHSCMIIHPSRKKLNFQRPTVDCKLFAGRFINAVMTAHASSITEYRRVALGNNFTLGSGITKYASTN